MQILNNMVNTQLNNNDMIKGADKKTSKIMINNN